MGLATLILVTVVSAGAPAPVPQVLDMPDLAVCQAVMDASLEGIKSAYVGNVMGYYKDVESNQENGWTVMRNPALRVIAQAKCLPHTAPSISRPSSSLGIPGSAKVSSQLSGASRVAQIVAQTQVQRPVR